MARIFISHSSVNNAAALALGSWLESQGWSDFFLDLDDDRGIAPGERWLAALAGAVDRCEAVLFLVSPAWRDSRYCFAEFFEAKKLGKRLFGVIIEPIQLSELPEQLTAEWQICDLTSPGQPLSISVSHPPLVAETTVVFPEYALKALARGLRQAGLDASTFVWPPAGDPARSPYPGLRALDEQDAAIFFGREAPIVRALDQLRLLRERGVDRLFTIFGASGAGKSSFLRAGLLPRLRRDADHFIVLPVVRSERAPMSGPQGLVASLKAALKAAGCDWSNAKIRAELGRNGLYELLRGIEASHASADPTEVPRTLLIPLDQAEEFFAADTAKESTQFLHLLDMLYQRLALPAEQAPEPRLRVVLLMTIRTDYLVQLQAEPVFQKLSPVLFSLPAMPASAFRSVIEEPARRHTETVAPLRVDPQLTEALTADAQGADALPLLALALEWLYREFSTPTGTAIGLEQYLALGGVRGVIGSAVQRAFEEPDGPPRIPAGASEQQQMLERLFPLLATVDPDTGQRKRRVALRAALRAEAVEALAVRLVDQRLLVSDTRGIGGDGAPVEVVEVAHEALLRQWDALERWLQAYAADLMAAEAVRRAAHDWQRSQSDPALLVHIEHRREAAEALLARPALAARFDEVDRQYVAACGERDRRRIQQLEDQRAVRAALQRKLARGMAIFSVLALAVAAVALWFWHQALESDGAARVALGKATAAQLALSGKAILAQERPGSTLAGALHVLAAWRIDAGTESYSAVQGASQQLSLLERLIELELPASSVALSLDGKHLASGGEDGAVWVWDAHTGAPIGVPLKGFTARVHSLEFSPDGSRLAAGSGRGELALWLLESGSALLAPQPVHTGSVSVSFNGNGTRLVSGASERVLRFWNALNGTAAETLEAQPSVQRLRFTVDGTQVVTAGEVGKLSWTDLRGGSLSQADIPYPTNPGTVTAQVSSDGKTAAMSGSFGEIWLWAGGGGSAATLRLLRSPSRQAGAMAFSGDGRWLATGDDAGVMNLWNVERGEAVGQTLRAHVGAVRGLAFGADGRRLATVGEDATLRLWRVETSDSTSVARRLDLSKVAFAGDGQRIVVSTKDGNLRLVDAVSLEDASPPVAAHSSPISALALTENGKLLASGAEDGSVRVSDARTLALVGQTLAGRGRRVSSIAFSPDGERLAIAVEGGALQALDRATGSFDLEWKTGQEKSKPLLALGPQDGQIVSTWGDGGELRLWNIKHGSDAGLRLRGHAGGVTGLAFFDGGRRIVSTGKDGMLRIWNVATGEEDDKPLRVTNRGGIDSLAVGPGGRHAATVTFDEARLWDLREQRPLGEPLAGASGLGLFPEIRFAPDGRQVVVAAQFLKSTRLRVWPVLNGWVASLCAKLPRNMTREEWKIATNDLPYLAPCSGLPMPPDKAPMPARYGDSR